MPGTTLYASPRGKCGQCQVEGRQESSAQEWWGSGGAGRQTELESGGSGWTDGIAKTLFGAAEWGSQGRRVNEAGVQVWADHRGQHGHTVGWKKGSDFEKSVWQFCKKGRDLEGKGP